MPVYKFRLSRKKAENLHARLKRHYRSQAGLPHLIVMAAYDYLCILRELDPDDTAYAPTDPKRQIRVFPPFRGMDT